MSGLILLNETSLCFYTKQKKKTNTFVLMETNPGTNGDIESISLHVGILVYYILIKSRK